MFFVIDHDQPPPPIPGHVPQRFANAKFPHGGKVALKCVEGDGFVHGSTSFDLFGFEQCTSEQPARGCLEDQDEHGDDDGGKGTQSKAGRGPKDIERF